MPAHEPDRNVQPGLLDRLTDEDPKRSAEAPLTRAQSLRQLKNSVRRDLEWLLNTRRISGEVPEAYKQLRNSLYLYGLPDLTSVRIQSSNDERRLLRSLEAAISAFEPRLGKVKVTALEPMVKKKLHSLKFQIEALLLIDPAPEHISFDTVLELTSGQYQVRGDAGA